MNRESHEVYEFGGFRLDPRRRVLMGADGAPIALKPKVFDTLLYFVEHAGEALDKGTLLAGIWPGVVVEENNLNKTVSELRRVLGETPDEHRFIVTVPGRGYRFVAVVSREAPPSSSSAAAAPSGSAAPTPPGSARVSPPAEARETSVSRRSTLGYVAAALAAGLVLVATAIYVTHVSLGESTRSAAPPSTRALATRFTFETAPTLNPLTLALSPDGRSIAYVGETKVGSAIWLRTLDSVDARMLPGTEGATETAYPFWSRDGRYVVYRVGSDLKRVEVDTGATSVITNAIVGYRRGAWGADDAIVVATENVILRFSANGGDGVPITAVDESIGELCHSAPSFLPDGRHFLYKATNVNRHNGAIYVGSVDPAEPRKRVLDASRAVYVEPGYVLFTREQTLFAQPFDAKRLELTGTPTQLTDDVVYREILDTSAFDAAAGTLIYRREPLQHDTAPLTWRDGAGNAGELTGAPTRVSMPVVDFELSRDGTKVAFADGIPPDVWTLDLERGARTRLTSAPEVDHNPVWSPDGTSVAFDSHREGRRQIFAKRADGAVAERVLYDAGAHDVRVTDWSADGRYLFFEKDTSLGGDYDIWVLPLEGGEAFAYNPTRFDERAATLSPDGHWIAYATSESGNYEIVVQSFPDPGVRRVRISANGGYAPRWARGGAELYYYDLTGSIVRVSLTDDLAIAHSERVGRAPTPYQWAVTANGERLLGLAPKIGDEGAGADGGKHFPIYVTVGWAAAIER
jgi:eukaryotic-like serine/threonine-protein kinase